MEKKNLRDHTGMSTSKRSPLSSYKQLASLMRKEKETFLFINCLFPIDNA